MPDISLDLTSLPTNLVQVPSPVMDTMCAIDQQLPQNSVFVQALEHEAEVGQLSVKEAGSVDDIGGEQTPDVVPAKVTVQLKCKYQ